LLEEAAKIQSSFKKKRKVTILARSVLCAAIWHFWKERNERAFQHKARHKIMVFRGLYEDIRELMRTCHWKSSMERNSLCVYSNWDV